MRNRGFETAQHLFANAPFLGGDFALAHQNPFDDTSNGIDPAVYARTRDRENLARGVTSCTTCNHVLCVCKNEDREHEQQLVEDSESDQTGDAEAVTGVTLTPDNLTFGERIQNLINQGQAGKANAALEKALDTADPSEIGAIIQTALDGLAAHTDPHTANNLINVLSFWGIEPDQMKAALEANPNLHAFGVNGDPVTGPEYRATRTPAPAGFDAKPQHTPAPAFIAAPAAAASPGPGQG